MYIRYRAVASFPGLPRFCSSVFVQYERKNRKTKKNGGGLGTRLQLCILCTCYTQCYKFCPAASALSNTFFPYILAKACVDEYPWSHARRTGMGEDWQCLCAQPWTTTVSGVCILVWFPDCTGMGTGNQTK